MNELALFAGAGGGLLATKWLLGWRTICYVEINPYRVEVLKARVRDGLLDDAPIWDDARTFDGRPWRGCVDIVTAGFPCQPFSQAGKQLADQDERNLWPDTIRIVREVRPEWCLLENTPGLLSGSHGYFGQILGELAESGYDAYWRVLSAAEMGAPHKRDRVWIVAHSSIKRGRAVQQPGQWDGSIAGCETMADPNGTRQLQPQGNVGQKRGWIGNGGQAMAHANQQGSSEHLSSGTSQDAGDRTSKLPSWWQVEPRLGRVADGVANRVERIAAIGDGQVPAVVRAVWGLLVGSEKGT